MNNIFYLSSDTLTNNIAITYHGTGGDGEQMLPSTSSLRSFRIELERLVSPGIYLSYLWSLEVSLVYGACGVTLGVCRQEPAICFCSHKTSNQVVY